MATSISWIGAGMDEARAMIDTGRWVGMTVIAAVVAELEEARATNKPENDKILP